MKIKHKELLNFYDGSCLEDIMLDELGYVYAIYDFLDYERVDEILLDLMKMRFRITDCSGSYDTIFEMKTEDALIKDATVVLLFFTKQITYSKRFTDQLAVVRECQKKIITIMLDAPTMIEIPEDLISIIQGNIKIKAYANKSDSEIVKEAGKKLKACVDNEKKDKLICRVLYILDLVTLLLLILASIQYFHTSEKIEKMKYNNMDLSTMKKDSVILHNSSIYSNTRV